jgi:hypothetical protein
MPDNKVKCPVGKGYRYGGRPKKIEKPVSMSAIIEDDEKEWLKKQATKEKTSTGGLIRKLISSYRMFVELSESNPFMITDTLITAEAINDAFEEL